MPTDVTRIVSVRSSANTARVRRGTMSSPIPINAPRNNARLSAVLAIAEKLMPLPAAIAVSSVSRKIAMRSSTMRIPKTSRV
jgi:hypothetical protein